MPDLATVEGVDAARLLTWMDSIDLGEGPLTCLRTLTGGTQNILVRVGRGNGRAVLRRPSLAAGEAGAASIAREVRALSLLADTDVPHPALIAACEDAEVLGAPFYLMAEAHGFCPAAGLSDAVAANPDAQRRMGFAMVEALATLSRAAAPTPDRGWLERQPGRWTDQLEGYGRLAGYVDSLDAASEVAEWLTAHRPATGAHGLVHGDFHFANVIVADDGSHVTAIVDWELSTAGDPLLDLAHLLATWPGSDETSITDRPAAPGLPGPDELVAAYGRLTGRDLREFRWFSVLACYRLAVLLEGTHARACAGQARRATGEALHAMAGKLLRRACNIYDS